MKLSDVFINEVKVRNDIESVVSNYVTLKRAGGNLVGLCPFHNEKTGSFTVYPKNGSFYCYGCAVGGDVITFCMRMENVDYMEAVRLLADRSGLQMPEEGYDDSLQRLRMSVYEVNREAARYFHAQLMSENGKAGLNYLTQRGLTPNIIRRFGLGFAPDSWDGLYKHLKSKGFSDDLMVQANLITPRKNSKGYFDRFRRRVMYPIIDLRSNVVAFGGRILPDDDSPAKYINTSDTPVYNKSRNVYAMNIAKNSKAESIILCEGYMDVIAMHQAGFDNAVAACGTAFTDEQARLLSRYANEIIVTMDADTAGQKSTNRTIGILSKTGVNVRVLRLPEAKDPDEYIKKFGAERFKMLLESAGNDIEYRLNEAKVKFDVDTDSGKLGYLREAAQILASVNDEIARSLYAGKLSQEYAIPLDSLKREIDILYKRRKKGEDKKALNKIIERPVSQDRINPERTANLRAAVAEETVLNIFMLHPSLLYEFDIGEDDFVTEFNRRIYIRIKEIVDNAMIPDITLFSGSFTPDEMGRIVEISNKSISGDVAKAELEGCIRKLRVEKNRLTATGVSEMDETQWAQKLKEFSETKRGDKK